MSSDTVESTSSTAAIPPIPVFDRVHGPGSRYLLRRTVLALAPIWILGVLPVVLDASASWKAFGLGLVFPGGGQLYTAHPVWAVVVFAAFPLAIGVWWLCGIVLLPGAVWVGAAIVAGIFAHADSTWDWAEFGVPALLLASLAAALGYPALRFRVLARRGREFNAALAHTGPRRPARPLAAATREATTTDLKTLRYVLDLALQPIESWDGFHFVKVDQFREGAVRYQLNFVSYTAAMYQYTCAPAFTGYAAEAQRNAITKMLHKPVWSYWSLENLWGNLRWNPDPIVDDNVMYSGYLGLMLGLYETSTGDRRYREPGCLELKWNDDKVFRHDFGTITDALVTNFERSRMGQYPCEPNWIYPMCNTFAVNSLLAYDRLSGTNVAGPVVDRVRAGYENGDFCEPDGRLTSARSEYFGFRHPMVGNMGDAITAYFLNPSVPDIGRRTWWLNRTFHLGPPDRPADFTHHTWSRLDPGNYGINDGFTRASLAANAREYGDEATYRALVDSLASRVVEQDGARRYKGISAWGNLWLALGTFGGEDAFRGLVCDGMPETAHTGPLLTEAAYPDVLVAKAVSDGRGLDLVLRAGAGGGRTTLRVERLVPHATYTTIGTVAEQVVADTTGAALIDIDLADRLEVRVLPA